MKSIEKFNKMVKSVNEERGVDVGVALMLQGHCWRGEWKGQRQKPS